MPEVRLRAVEDWEEEEPQLDEANPWEWCRSFLGTNASQGNDPHFTLDDGVWKRVVGYQRIGREIVHRDYAGSEGKTVRFGDGEFGMVPNQGTIFQVTYRLGNGRRGNVAADSLTGFDRGSLGFIEAVTNPLPVENGVDPETPQQVRQLAPDAFRAITYRAVRPEDYAEAAERLPWVQRASGSFRWTGSWITAFVTPDPLDATALTEDQHRELSEQIDRFRQAGREAYVAEPRYADLDLEITICVEPFAYRGEVKERVLEALLGRIGQPGFFSPDNFTFGTPLRRSQLEATIQRVTGVKAVEGIRYRRRGVFDWRDLAGPHYPVGDFEVIRVDNDPNHPGHGSLKLEMRGGA
jgi:predicted phage baseplate assembly protein